MLTLFHLLTGLHPDAQQPESLPPNWASVTLSQVVIDSRLAVADSLFVALEGDRTDGHRFLCDAAQRGARAALVQREALTASTPLPPNSYFIDVTDAASVANLANIRPPSSEGTDAPFLLICVDRPLHAMHRLARFHRQQLHPKVVAVTGSVGKTSTKEVVASVLSRRFSTLKAPASYNSEASVPTVLLQLRPTHEVAVLELGMWAPGEIRHLASLAQPHIGILTNIGPSHLERMGSMQAIVNAKAELIEALPSDGVALLNADDERVRNLADRTAARVVTYGSHLSADLWAESVESYGLRGIVVKVRAEGQVIRLQLPLAGRHHVSTALAAAATGHVLGLSWDEIIAGLQQPTSLVRTSCVTIPSAPARTHAGIRPACTIIDDTYNASPASVLAALSLLAELDGYRIAVLGDMLELGSVEEESHRLVGAEVYNVAQMLVCLGSRTHQWLAPAAREAGMPSDVVYCAETHQDAVDWLEQRLEYIPPSVSHVYILVKGSRGLSMETIVQALRDSS